MAFSGKVLCGESGREHTRKSKGKRKDATGKRRQANTKGHESDGNEHLLPYARHGAELLQIFFGWKLRAGCRRLPERLKTFGICHGDTFDMNCFHLISVSLLLLQFGLHTESHTNTDLLRAHHPPRRWHWKTTRYICASDKYHTEPVRKRPSYNTCLGQCHRQRQPRAHALRSQIVDHYHATSHVPVRVTMRRR
jgi:hypothetical protein